MRGARILVAALLLGACNGGRGGSAEPTLPPRASTTTTTAPDYSVPAVIDVAYVERVMEALDRVYGDAIRILARERKITQEFLEHLAAIYGDRFFRLAQEAWGREAAEGLPTLADFPGDPMTEVVRIVRSDERCVVAAVRRDFSPIRITSPAGTPQRFIAMLRKTAGSRSSVNSTPWVITYDGWTDTGEEPTDPCVA